MTPKIKICGLTDPKEVEYLIDPSSESFHAIQYAGLVLFFSKSKRNNTPESAASIIMALKELEKKGTVINKVAVTVSPTLEQVKIIEELGFDIIQIHGELKPEVLDTISIPIFRAYNIDSAINTEEFVNEPKIIGILFDGKVSGSGNTFDWSKLKTFDKRDKLLILAGGLDETNVAQAICEVHPDIVDVSSGVEYEPVQEMEKKGKDPDRIRKFVDAI